MSISNTEITAGILAGGAGRRLGGHDKGWLRLAGRPQIERVRGVLQPQVGAIRINTDRNRAACTRLDPDPVSDGRFSQCGPMAGIRALLNVCETPWLLCVPVDAPRLPEDLVSRLAGALHHSGAEAAVAQSPGGPIPVCCLLSRSLAPSATTWLDTGGRRVETWLQQIGAIAVDFPDHPEGWSLNTPLELAVWRHRLMTSEVA